MLKPGRFVYLSGFLVGRGLAPAAYVGTGVLDGPIIASFAFMVQMPRASPDPYAIV